ncbi:hypothetical protein LV780_13395 [Cereibacter azotoformans]|uniref:Uncharacterized protein n=1 Tax=Cereibacter azotoformans TaxID=43057 RepID=A0A2T5JV10_9RHOB|nr:hypothetical protein [Cereibacter azotoformans]MBO4170430.1 hypothetical protein [Cereibacter azotoformans]PTR14011.1 hypothetical protein C8J28_1186 [Cereibacter azotoformans]UIJ30282.1 hypothetical protein LV780_13395 [Cereibacter azotoformans]
MNETIRDDQLAAAIEAQSYLNSTAVALERIDTALRDNTEKMAALKSRELLLQAARGEIIQRDRAREALLSVCLAAGYTYDPCEEVDDGSFDGGCDSIGECHCDVEITAEDEIVSMLGERLIDCVQGIRDCADRVDA